MGGPVGETIRWEANLGEGDVKTVRLCERTNGMNACEGKKGKGAAHRRHRTGKGHLLLQQQEPCQVQKTSLPPTRSSVPAKM